MAAPTGSGKSLAFVLPVLNALANRKIRRLRALVVLPSRDLGTYIRCYCCCCCSCWNYLLILILFYFILFVCVCYYNAAEQVFDVFDRYCVGSDLKIGLAIGQTISSRTKGVGGWR
jgi:hypothetical protein